MATACLVSTFDMVNVADLSLLEQVKSSVDDVVVAVLDDAQVTRLHGRGPVVGEQERLELVQHLRATDQVLLCSDVADLAGRGWRLISDEEALEGQVDELITPERRSASPQLRHALAHGHVSQHDPHHGADVA